MEVTSLAIEHSAVLALSRPLRAAFGGGLRPALTGAARAALAVGRSGRRDGPFRSNKGMPLVLVARRSGLGEELVGIKILVTTPHGMQSMQQFAHQGDDGLQPGLAASDQPIDKACPWQGTGGGGLAAAASALRVSSVHAFRRGCEAFCEQ